jgi:hypothetical protein
MIQLAWRFLRFQKESALARWYQARTADSRIGTRKTMIVALGSHTAGSVRIPACVTGNVGLKGLAEPHAEAILDLALGAWDPQSDGLVAACLNFRSHLVIDVLEARTGKPVISSTQAVLWHLLRLAGVTRPIPGYGRLLRVY